MQKQPPWAAPWTLHRKEHRPLEIEMRALLAKQQRILGLPALLYRVEPTRPDKVLSNADYIAWADYCKNDPTSPGKWFNEHPAAPLPPTRSSIIG